MGAMASHITNLTIVYSTVYSGTDQRKYHSSASLAFVRGIRRRPGNSPHKWPVTRKGLPYDDVIILYGKLVYIKHSTNTMNLTAMFFVEWCGMTYAYIATRSLAEGYNKSFRTLNINDIQDGILISNTPSGYVSLAPKFLSGYPIFHTDRYIDTLYIFPRVCIHVWTKTY